MHGNGFKAKAIFFDLDGTIVDSSEAYTEAARVAFQAIGQTPPPNEVVLEIPRRLEQGFSITDITNGEARKFLSVYLKTYYSITRQKTKLIPHVSATLKALSEKNKLALITMRYVPKRAITKELEFFGISTYFSRVVTARDPFKPKPSPEAIISCVQALDVEVCDCIIAGDSVNDVRAGKAAGARTVAVLSGLFQSEELAKEGPDLILNDVTALPKIIK
ncbi:MAG TPA: HAD family hydrolase [Candidatus Limnocylindrales bacterium]|nr:HAD family hydrolase [Candidatus Limnocylindrales bacterium]